MLTIMRPKIHGSDEASFSRVHTHHPTSLSEGVVKQLAIHDYKPRPTAGQALLPGRLQ